MNSVKAFVVLESGETYEGVWNSPELKLNPRIGELVFNTSHCGYQELATDPSYYNQIVVMTAPMQGNYGCRAEDKESDKYWINGFVCLENESHGKQWLRELAKGNVPVISNVDTRSLTLNLRDRGSVWGGLCVAGSREEAQKKISSELTRHNARSGDWTQNVCISAEQSLEGSQPLSRMRIVLIDFGTKKNIVRELLNRCSELIVVPSGTSADRIRELSPNGICLSNGPGDPSQVIKGVECVRSLMGWRPIMGICMGHQVLALALGGKTFKMKFGHRGGNHPVRDLLLKQIYMTSQNHGYAVDEKSLPDQTQVTHVNLYDKSLEGFELREKKCMSVQFHPESSPGPHEAQRLFDLFLSGLK